MVRRKPLLAGCLVWLLGMVISTWSVAAIPCPKTISPEADISTETWYGARFEQPYYFNIQGVWFEVPLGYSQPWPGPDGHRLLGQRTPENPEPAGLSPATGVRFAFWMPSLRWLERDGLSVISFRPCENGRTLSPEEFIVKALVDWPWLPNPEQSGFITPKIRHANALRNLGMAEDGSQWGLKRLTRPDGKGSTVYVSDGAFTPNIFFLCTSDWEKLPNPGCRGNAWWPDERLGLWVSFSRSDLPKWQEIVTAARSLAHRWRIHP